jgi:hypothetical protein
MVGISLTCSVPKNSITGDNYGCPKGLGFILVHGLDDTRVEPTSMPTTVKAYTVSNTCGSA